MLNIILIFFTESISAFISISGNHLQDRIPELYSKTLTGVKSVTDKIKIFHQNYSLLGIPINVI